MLHECGHNHSKADYYPEHLFIRILNHTLAPDYDEDEDEDMYPSSSVADPPTEADPNSVPLTDEILPSDSGTRIPSPRVQSLVNAARQENARSSSASASPAPSLSNLQVLANGLPPSDSASAKDEFDETEGQADISQQHAGSQKRQSRGRRLLSSAKNALTRRMTALSGYHSEASTS